MAEIRDLQLTYNGIQAPQQPLPLSTAICVSLPREVFVHFGKVLANVEVNYVTSNATHLVIHQDKFESFLDLASQHDIPFKICTNGGCASDFSVSAKFAVSLVVEIDDNSFGVAKSAIASELINNPNFKNVFSYCLSKFKSVRGVYQTVVCCALTSQASASVLLQCDARGLVKSKSFRVTGLYAGTEKPASGCRICGDAHEVSRCTFHKDSLPRLATIVASAPVHKDRLREITRILPVGVQVHLGAKPNSKIVSDRRLQIYFTVESTQQVLVGIKQVATSLRDARVSFLANFRDGESASPLCEHCLVAVAGIAAHDKWRCSITNPSAGQWSNRRRAGAPSNADAAQKEMAREIADPEAGQIIPQIQVGKRKPVSYAQATMASPSEVRASSSEADPSQLESSSIFQKSSTGGQHQVDSQAKIASRKIGSRQEVVARRPSNLEVLDPEIIDIADRSHKEGGLLPGSSSRPLRRAMCEEAAYSASSSGGDLDKPEVSGSERCAESLNVTALFSPTKILSKTAAEGGKGHSSPPPSLPGSAAVATTITTNSISNLEANSKMATLAGNPSPSNLRVPHARPTPSTLGVGDELPGTPLGSSSPNVPSSSCCAREVAEVRDSSAAQVSQKIMPENSVRISENTSTVEDEYNFWLDDLASYLEDNSASSATKKQAPPAVTSSGRSGRAGDLASPANSRKRGSEEIREQPSGSTPDAQRPKSTPCVVGRDDKYWEEQAKQWLSKYLFVGGKGLMFHGIRAIEGITYSKVQIGVHKQKDHNGKVPRTYYEGENCKQKVFRSEAAAHCFVECSNEQYDDMLFDWIEKETGPRRNTKKQL